MWFKSQQAGEMNNKFYICRLNPVSFNLLILLLNIPHRSQISSLSRHQFTSAAKLSWSLKAVHRVMELGSVKCTQSCEVWLAIFTATFVDPIVTYATTKKIMIIINMHTIWKIGKLYLPLVYCLRTTTVNFHQFAAWYYLDKVKYSTTQFSCSFL